MKFLKTMLFFCFYTVRLCSQNVGIGTTSPADKLHVLNGNITLENSASNYPLLTFRNNNVLKGYLGVNNNELRIGTWPGTNSTGNISLVTNNIERLRVTSDGNIGMGINAPIANLHVADAGGSATIFAIGRNYTGGGFTAMYMGNSANAGGYNYVQSVGVSGSAFGTLALNPSGGNVGIGTAAPTAKLDVNGSFRLNNGTQGANRILVSDASGQAEWQDRNIYFLATVNIQGFSTQSMTPHNYEVIHCTANGANPYFSGDVFTAPVAGFYHFDLCFSVSNNGGPAVTQVHTKIMNISANTTIASTHASALAFEELGYDAPVSISTNTFLQAGQ